MKSINLKFHDEDLHKAMKMQALKEDSTLQNLIIKACKEYLEKVEKSKDKK